MKKNITIIFLANFFTLLSGVVTSLLTAWSLGPEGRGDLAVIVLYPNVVALAVGLGLQQAHRYRLARHPQEISGIFSNALIFTIVMGALAYGAAELIVPSLVGERSEFVMWMVRFYLINIPLALLYDLMAGMLEGSRQFKWAALSRIVFFGIQSSIYFLLWISGHLTIFNAAFTMIVAQVANTLTALFCVSRVLRPRWKPSWTIWKNTIAYGLKYHVGVLTSFTTLRLDQLMLGGMASSAEIGLYVIAVRLSEITTVLASSVADVLMPEVAASKQSDRSTQLLTRSVRQMILIYLVILAPLILGAPLILKYVFGAEFIAAGGTLRLLLVASMIWSVGAIIISGLNGLGYPGLSTISRLLSAVVTVFALLYCLPKYGIIGAAFSSLVGYSVMLVAALFWLVRKKDIRLRELLIPRSGDFPVKKLMTTLKSRFGLQIQTETNDLQKNYCYHQLFEQQATANPDHIAVVCNDQKLTYGELNARANQLAAHLRSLGAKEETLIPICVDRSIEMAVGILGILKSGAAYVPIDPAYPAERIEFMLADTKAPFIVTQSFHLQSSETKKVLLDLDWEVIKQYSTENLSPVANSENLAYVIYTSGSTGKPKGAMLTHDNLCHYVEALQQEFTLTPEDKYLHLASIAFSSSRRHMLFPLAQGASVVIADEELRMDPLPLFKLVKEQSVTIFDAVPSFQRHCMNALLELETEERNELLNNDLRLIVSASEPLLSDIPATWMFDFKHPAQHVHMIGQTETSGIVSLNRVTAEDAAGTVRPIPVGRAIANTEIFLLDENQRPVVMGEPGEIYVRGRGLGRGYLNRPELNEQKFIELNVENKLQKVCRTGDYARILPDGRMECLGRQDFQVKVRGQRVELGEVEAVLIGHADVLACSVIGREDEPGQIRLVAYIVSRQKSASVIENLRTLAKEKLPDYMQPAGFMLIDALPLTPNGKIDRKGLPKPDESAFVIENKNYIAPRNSIEQAVAEVWAEVLGFKQISIEDDFFNLGGHSLLAGKVIARLRKIFNLEIPLRTIFEAKTISNLAEKISQFQQQTGYVSENALTKIERPEQIPLSFAQQRLWFLAQMDNGSSAYNMSEVVSLEGNLDAGILRSAIESIVARHEILRTSFHSINGQPSQVVSSKTTVDFTIDDLSDSFDGAKEKTALEIASKTAAEPFDLTNCPLLRLKLIKLGENENLLVIVFHHIISDGWSTGVFLNELSELYQAALNNSTALLPALPIQYADYSVWQQKWTETGEYKSQLEFWKEQLEDAPALLELPTDFSRPAVQRYQGAQCSTQIPAELAGEIKELCREQGVTLFMTLLSAFELLMSRYSGQEQLVVGTPIAGRTKTETENLIGFFVNTLALRGDLSGNPTFKELLQKTRERALGAFGNQELPFEKLVEELKPERSLSYSPVFQVMFALQNASGTNENFAGLKLKKVTLPSSSAKFDLSLDAFENENGLELQLEYDTDLFKTETIQQMLEHFLVILKSIVANPELKLNDVPILTESETDVLLNEWNQRSVEIPPVCLHQLIEKHAAQTPDAIAVVWKNERLTYGELNAKTNQLAHFLKKQNIKPETIVGVYVERSLETIISILGVLKAGCAYLPLDPNYPAERLQHMTSDAGVSVLITQENLKSKAADFASSTVICIDDDWSAIALESVQNPESEVTTENAAYVIFTSGSTGKSKGVMVTHKNVVNAHTAWEDAYHLSAIKSHLQMASFSFDVFTGDFTRALCSGAKLVLCPTELLLESELLCQLMRDEKIEAAEFVPAVIRPLIEYLEVSGKSLDFVKLLVVGSDVWQMEELRRLKELCGSQTRVISSYGVTEATIDSTFFELSAENKDGEGIVPIGRPFANTQIYLLDANQNLVPIGVPGELYLGGSGVARGYLNRPELTKERFIEWTSPVGNALKLYRTGDVARYRSDGMIEILGRADNQVKLRGYRIELGEIETVLARHSDVNECVVIVREDVPGDKRLTAYLTAKTGEINSAELRGHIKSFLPEYMIPSAFVLIDEWKLTPNGKIDRRQLPAPEGTSTSAETEYIAPRTPLEEKLVDIWSSLLRCEKVGINDNFFELGGHSLLATQVVSRTRDAFGKNVSLRTLFEAPTVAGLAEQIINLNGTADNKQAITQQKKPRELPLSCAQQRLWFLDQFEPGNKIYNLPVVWRVNGKVEPQILEQSINKIIARHNVVRTKFTVSNDKPVRIVADTLNLELEIIDADNDTQAENLIRERINEPFDLQKQEPLVRASLVRLSEDEHYLAVVFHHIISDGWSIGVFLKELGEFYEAGLKNLDSSRSALPIQYADFALWQEKWLETDDYRKQLDFWKQQLSGAPALLELNSDYPRPAVQRYQGAQCSAFISSELTQQLNDLSRKEGVTMFMTLLSVFEMLLSKYSGQEQLVVGTPIAGRTKTETESLIGFFVNTLALRGDLSGNPTFREMLRRTKEKALGAYANQDLPFERLVEEINPKRSMSYSPLFQVMFALQNSSSTDENFADLKLSRVKFPSQTAKFDLSLDVFEENGGLNLWMEYDTDLFKTETIQQMLEVFQFLLKAVVHQPESRLSELIAFDGTRWEISKDFHTLSETPANIELIPLQTSTEIVVGEIWKKLLRQEEIGSNSDFFDLGGHSLLALKVILRLRTHFGLEIPLRHIFEHSTVQSLSVMIDQMQEEKQEQELEALLAELENISEEEVQQILASESDPSFV